MSFADRIRKMNVTFGLGAPSTPQMVPDAYTRIHQFFRVLSDENLELFDALPSIPKKEDAGAAKVEKELNALTSLADTFADIVVYVRSEAARYGIPLEEVLDIVMDSQDSKLDDEGLPILAPDRSKFIKGPNYEPPEPRIRALLAERMAGGGNNGNNDSNGYNWGRLALDRHPILQGIHDAIQAIERCGASVALTDAVNVTAQLSEMAATILDEWDNARMNARGTARATLMAVDYQGRIVLQAIFNQDDSFIWKAQTGAYLNGVSEFSVVPAVAKHPTNNGTSFSGKDLSEATKLLGSGALMDIARERERQKVNKGYSAAHDDSHEKGELARAAACYALSADPSHSLYLETHFQALWPFENRAWRPKTNRKNLLKAAALLLAEIERRDRIEKLAPSTTART